MKSKMTQQELSELKEMTGLVTEEELKSQPVTATPSASVTYYDIARPTRVYTAQPQEDYAKYIGQYVRVGSEYGVIDDVHKGFNTWLGFVFSHGDSWTGCLVDPNDVVILTAKDDIEKARTSALRYFMWERESVTNRINMRIKGDNIAKLSHALWVCNKWIKKLTA